MALRERIDKICCEKHITTKALANLSGLLPQTLYDIRNEKIKSITTEKARKINAVFPEYSTSWIVCGEPSPDGVAISQTAEARRVAELEKELQKANERIDLLLSMLAGSYKPEEIESGTKQEKESQSRKRGRPRKE